MLGIEPERHDRRTEREVRYQPLNSRASFGVGEDAPRVISRFLPEQFDGIQPNGEAELAEREASCGWCATSPEDDKILATGWR